MQRKEVDATKITQVAGYRLPVYGREGFEGVSFQGHCINNRCEGKTHVIEEEPVTGNRQLELR